MSSRAGSRIAAVLAGYRDRFPGLAANTPSSGEQPTGDPVTVEFLIDGLWTDVTSRVMTRDGSQNITITTGRSGEAAAIDPGRCAFQLNNRDGLFSPRNPNSPYYGKIGRNTKMRVSVPNGNAKEYRFQGEIPAWPVKWDSTGNDVWVDIEAAGILRRLSQGSTPLKSAMLREFTKPSRASRLVAYWPCEDAVGSTSIASGLPGDPAMAITGSVTLAGSSTWPASDSLPLMETGKFTGAIPTYTLDTFSSISLRFFVQTPVAGVGSTQRLASIDCTGSARRWSIWINSTGQLDLRAYDVDGTQILATGFATYSTFINGDLAQIGLELVDFLAISVTYTLTAFSITDGTLTNIPTTNLSGSLLVNDTNLATRVTVGEDGALGDTAIGHIAVASATTAYADTGPAMVAFAGETAGARIQRLEGEEGIAFGQIGTLSDTAAMGVQGRDKLLDLVTECATADMGLLYERWTTFGLGYRTRVSLENQDAGLALTYGPQLAAIPEPVDDDQLVTNQVTASRSGGSSAVASLDTGALSTMDPPNGVGLYDTSVTVNVQADGDLPDQAAWRVHLGTVDEARYPQITVNLAHPTFTGSTTLRGQALAIRPGYRITIDDPPSWLPPGPISVLVVGTSETIDFFQHIITYNCVPESPYHLAVTDADSYGWVDTDGSILAADISTTATSMLVSPTGDGGLWTTDVTDPPFDITMGGETMTVSAVTGSSDPQTFTMTRSINGIVKAHTAGEDIRLADPAIVAL
jgi:hypothetical protein